MKNYTILIDTREKKNGKHKMLLWQFKELGINYKDKKLDAGDYSFEVDGVDYSKQFAIERKSGNPLRGGGFNELKGNIFEYKKSTPKDKRCGYGIRIRDEFVRLRDNRTEIVLLIENASYFEDYENCEMFIGQRRAYHSNDQFIEFFNKWITDENILRINDELQPIKFVYCQHSDTGKTIVELIDDFMLKNIEF